MKYFLITLLITVNISCNSTPYYPGMWNPWIPPDTKARWSLMAQRFPISDSTGRAFTNTDIILDENEFPHIIALLEDDNDVAPVNTSPSGSSLNQTDIILDDKAFPHIIALLEDDNDVAPVSTSPSSSSLEKNDTNRTQKKSEHRRYKEKYKGKKRDGPQSKKYHRSKSGPPHKNKGRNSARKKKLQRDKKYSNQRRLAHTSPTKATARKQPRSKKQAPAGKQRGKAFANNRFSVLMPYSSSGSGSGY